MPLKIMNNFFLVKKKLGDNAFNCSVPVGDGLVNFDTRTSIW